MGAIATVIIILIIIVPVLRSRNKKRKIAALQRQYHDALRGVDKRAALDAGRAYYNALNDGKGLRMFDEQTISNDLSTMVLTPQ